jgi:hypothetical protein
MGWIRDPNARAVQRHASASARAARHVAGTTSKREVRTYANAAADYAERFPRELKRARRRHRWGRLFRRGRR